MVTQIGRAENISYGSFQPVTGRRQLIEMALFGAAPPVGIADNGDFPKTIARFALVAEPASANDAPGYVTIRYVKDPMAWWVSSTSSTEIPSSGRLHPDMRLDRIWAARP